MALLIITTILWAFSFSLYGEYLAGHVDSYFAVLARVGLAALVFLPFLRTRGQSLSTIGLYMLVGAMQLGIMYMLSFQAYLYLTVSELLLFTVLTPLYITLIYDVMSRRRLRWGYACSALLAVIGAGIIRYDQVTNHFWTGLILVQLSNISFAIGMVGYKRLMETRPMPQHNAFAWFYIGAFLVAARMGIAALPHWVVESFERQGLVVTKTLGEGLWSRLYAAVRDGEQRQPVTEAFIRSARNHACDHLPFVRSAERPSVDGPIARPGSPERQ